MHDQGVFNRCAVCCSGMQVDKEIRHLRESAPERVDARAIAQVVQACVQQQQLYHERRSSGCMSSSWLAAPRSSVAGSQAPFSSMHGAVSLAGPCADGGDVRSSAVTIADSAGTAPSMVVRPQAA